MQNNLSHPSLACEKYKLFCCYCSKKIPFLKLEDHIKCKCLQAFESLIHDQTSISSEFIKLFREINNGNFNILFNAQFIEQFNQMSLAKYNDYYYPQIIAWEKREELNRKFMQEEKEIIYDKDMPVSCVDQDGNFNRYTYGMLLLKIISTVSIESNKMKSYLNFCKLSCPFCINVCKFVLVKEHLRICLAAKSSWINPVNDYPFPDLNIIKIIFNEFTKDEVNTIYISYLVRLFNFQVRRMFSKTLLDNIENFAQPQAIEEKNIQNVPKEIPNAKCYICETLIPISELICHLKKCKVMHKNDSQIFVEPPMLNALIDKLRNQAEDYISALNEYNCYIEEIIHTREDQIMKKMDEEHKANDNSEFDLCENSNDYYIKIAEQVNLMNKGRKKREDNVQFILRK